MIRIPSAPAEPEGPPKPILRWAGGKRQLVGRLLKFVPPDINERVYREPFLGAGCLFFALQPQKAILSDANEHLISCYKVVRDEWRPVARNLRLYAARNSRDNYYRIRTRYNMENRHRFSAAQAARFIYLNKACFNGIFRVNQKGEFNVPYGWKEPPAIPSRLAMASASAALNRAVLRTQRFDKALESASEHDFVYLDPPYPPLNRTAYFTHYTRDRFNTEDQKKLAETVWALHRRGCLIIMTNADTSLIRRLYRGFYITSLPVTRFITCKAKKHIVRELVITNYEVTTWHTE